MTKFNPDGKAVLTYADCYDPAMNITDQADADQYKAELIKYQAKFPHSKHSAEEVVNINLGYYAGYYSPEVRERVERLFKTVHPVFGSISDNGAPTAKQALEAGIKLSTALITTQEEILKKYPLTADEVFQGKQGDKMDKAMHSELEGPTSHEISFIERGLKLRENLSLIDTLARLYKEYCEQENQSLRSELQKQKELSKDVMRFYRWMTDEGWQEHSSGRYFFKLEYASQWPPPEKNCATEDDLIRMWNESLIKKSKES